MSMAPPLLLRVDLASESPVSRYLKATAAVCPFIEPAARAGVLFASEVTPDCQTAQDIHPRLFEQLTPRIERFRDDRRVLTEKHQRLLICHFVVMHLPPSLDRDAVRLLNWPNWLGLLLKQLYTRKEIVFGFVRKNVSQRSSFAAAVPVAPFHALVIRSRVVGLDGRFFTGNQPLSQAMMQAEDDDADVHAAALGDVPDIRDPQAIRDANYYQRVQQWGQKMLPRR